MSIDEFEQLCIEADETMPNAVAASAIGAMFDLINAKH